MHISNARYQPPPMHAQTESTRLMSAAFPRRFCPGKNLVACVHPDELLRRSVKGLKFR